MSPARGPRLEDRENHAFPRGTLLSRTHSTPTTKRKIPFSPGHSISSSFREVRDGAGVEETIKEEEKENWRQSYNHGEAAALTRAALTQPQHWKEARPEDLPCSSCGERDVTARAGDGRVPAGSERAREASCRHTHRHEHPGKLRREFQEGRTKGNKMQTM